MKLKCIIVGAGTYGQVYAEYLKDIYDIIGFIDDNEKIVDSYINEIRVLGNFKFLLNKIHKSTAVFVPIGNNVVRMKMLINLKKNGFLTPNFIHHTANVHENVLLGNAVYILGSSNIMPFSKIDNFVMISMGVNIAHHTVIGVGSFLSQGTNIGASIIFAEKSFVGIGSTIMTGVETVGRDSVVGAGSMVIKNVPDYAVVVGNPGRIIKFNNPD